MIIEVNPNRVIGRRDEKIFGHFIEHFHRQIYGGIFDPDSPLSDAQGFRSDVVAALKRIKPAIMRWPGGCFVSSYHWRDAVGPNRKPYFDKAWRVEEPCTFGTDEFVAYCRAIEAEPYICSNAGTGSSEELSDWVEYCNLRDCGYLSRMRAENGYADPHAVKYWSIGNENWGAHEIGAKAIGEWGRYVAETAKMIRRVDPSVEILAASVPSIEWNMDLLKEAGEYLDWISVHHYWDPLWQDNHVASYEKAMVYSMSTEDPIKKTIHILGAMDYLGRIRIAFDEWNLKGWHHPNIHQGLAMSEEDYLTPRDKNDIASDYTMADAVFSACFLNACLRNCHAVGMANFAPSVNTRGMIYTHSNGMVLRPTYHVYDLYVNHMQPLVIDSFLHGPGSDFELVIDEKAYEIQTIDHTASVSEDGKLLSIALVNRHPETSMRVEGTLPEQFSHGQAFYVSGRHKDDYNDIGHENRVRIEEDECRIQNGTFEWTLPAHSVSVLTFSTSES